VLEAIVQQENIRAEPFLDSPAHRPAVCADADVRIPGADEDLRFIAGHAYRSLDAGRYYHALVDGTPPVSARQDRGMTPSLAQSLSRQRNGN
jgi:hypothetical protein